MIDADAFRLQRQRDLAAQDLLTAVLMGLESRSPGYFAALCTHYRAAHNALADYFDAKAKGKV